MASKRARPSQVIGWREWVTLPDLGVKAIKAKVDTGARSSSLHAFDIEYFRKGRVKMVRFSIHPLQRNSKKRIIAEAELLEYRKVKSSGGHETVRPVIVADVQLLGVTWPIELTLATRDTMGFRMLLGRQAVRNRFLINPGMSYIGGKPKKSSRGKKSTPKKKQR